MGWVVRGGTDGERFRKNMTTKALLLTVPPALATYVENLRVAVPAGILVAFGLFASAPAQAQGSAWLAEPGTGFLSMSYVHQSADEFYAGPNKMPTPQGEDLRQNTVWVAANYFLSDVVALDIKTGWAMSQFITGPGIPAAADSFSGVVDTDVGVTWRLTDEWTGGWPSMAVRAGATVAGNYETGSINAIGDGGDGYQLSLIVAKFLSERIGVSAEVGQQRRNNDIPTNTFAHATGLWLLNNRLTVGVDYTIVSAASSIDIQGPGFTPARFPEVQEDYRAAGGRLYYDVSDNLTMALFYTKKFSGRNTALSGVYGATFSYSFGN